MNSRATLGGAPAASTTPIVQETLLSSLQKFQSHDALPQHVTHPFTSSAEQSCNLLQDLIHTTDQISNTLGAFSLAPWSNPKLVSMLRQHSLKNFQLNASEINASHMVDSLRKRSGIGYDESIPLDPSSIPGWCISRLESWGKSLGMETFKDSREGAVTVMFAGKVLVVDVDLAFEREDLLKPTVKVASVKTSYAISNNGLGTPSKPKGSISLDAFLADSIQRYCVEVQKGEDVRDPEEAARLRDNVLDQLRYLVTLDQLAERKSDDGGIRWFVDIDELCPILENFARSEAEVVASSLSLIHTPVDIFLLRSHALPLPYLVSPSISFLTYLSPLAYLTLLRSSPAQSEDINKKLLQFDIPLSHLRSIPSHLSGVTIATLSLTTHSGSQLFPASMSMPNLMSRPTFSLVSSGSELEHVFPQLSDSTMLLDTSGSTPEQHVWVLDFTDGGKHRGIVMSQTRMRDIELVVNPLADMSNLGAVGMISFGMGSWVDLLFNHNAGVSPERYTAIYRSPTAVHPPLQLRLTAPEEPGFLLERVPVHNMKEIWGILEIVREQCWLNEILASCHWTMEGLKSEEEQLPLESESEPTEDMLQAVLSGTFPPRKIPVNVFLPSHNESADSLFGAADLDPMAMSLSRRPKIIMTSPERPPISGLVEVIVSFDESKPRGVSVEVQGAMGADIKLDVLEEVVRRGGTLGLSGRVWAKAHGASL